MGSMSMSDPAPLPRLGEVFFDVRSPSRSLRISWYADTGVAVLSIWQGGTCTGSFRLPMGDLPRMIETLERGPDGQGIPAVDYPAHPPGAQPPRAPEAQYPREAGHPGAAAGYDAYQAGAGSLHYLNGSAPAQYPDETSARYMDGAASARHPDETSAGYPHGAAPAHYPDETSAGHPDGPVPSGYRDAPVPPYSGEPGPADYPGSATRRDFPAEPAGGPYPDGPYPDGKYPDDKYPGGEYARDPYAGDRYSGDQYAGDQYAGDPYPADHYSRDPYPAEQYPDPAGHYPDGAEPRDHSPRPAGIDYPQPVPGSSYGDGRPGRADEQQAPGPESGTAGPAGHGLDPLPESFPYGQPHRSHRL
jgi:hypothetical protein